MRMLLSRAGSSDLSVFLSHHSQQEQKHLSYSSGNTALMLIKYVVSGDSLTFASTNRLGWLVEASAAFLLLDNALALLFLICSFLLIFE